MNKPAEIQKHYNIASDLAIELIIETARKIMRKHPKLIEYVQGMGTWFFADKNGKYYTDENICKPLDDIMQEWDEAFHLTGQPLRFTVDGPVIKEW